MAAIVGVLQSASPGAPIMNYSGGVVVDTWSALLNNSTPGTPLQAANFIVNSVQVTGDFGVGGSINLEGSNDGINWAIMPDINDNAATWTTGGIKFFKESTVWVRPNVTAGDGTTSLKMIVSLRKQVMSG